MKKKHYTAEHLRHIQELSTEVSWPIVYGYDTVKDELGIMHPDSVVIGEGKEWIIYRGKPKEAVQ